MRVFAVTKGYPPTTAVGAWVATHLLLRHLVAVGHEVTVFARHTKGADYAVGGVDVVTGRRGRTQAVAMAAGADVLVSSCGDVGVPEAIAAETGLRHARLAHGRDAHAGVGAADLVVFNSVALQAGVAHSVPSVVCRPPVDRVAHEVEATGDRVTLVNTSEAKGGRVAWRVAEACPGRRFLGVSGWGEQLRPRTANWEQLRRQRDMRTVWAQTRVLLMPSAFETWGMAGVEAMCSGIPVIAHPTAGLRESLGPAGIFADRADTGAWVAALEHLDDPDTYRAASAAARARVDDLARAHAGDLAGFTTALEALCAS